MAGSGSFEYVLQLCKYGKMYEREDEPFEEMLVSNKDFRKFKYFKYDDKTPELRMKDIIRTKIQIRGVFEDSIRKSIHRYIPANTTLWKIEYSGL